MVDGFYKTVRTIISQLGYEYLTNATLKDAGSDKRL